MYYAIGASVSSLHRESTDSPIYIHIQHNIVHVLMHISNHVYFSLYNVCVTCQKNIIVNVCNRMSGTRMELPVL